MIQFLPLFIPSGGSRGGGYGPGPFEGGVFLVAILVGSLCAYFQVPDFIGGNFEAGVIRFVLGFIVTFMASILSAVVFEGIATFVSWAMEFEGVKKTVEFFSVLMAILLFSWILMGTTSYLFEKVRFAAEIEMCIKASRSVRDLNCQIRLDLPK